MPNKNNINSPVTVISNPRSGTTLISEMFKLHPSFSSVGETGNLICDSWHAVEFARGITVPTIENRQILSTEEKAGRIVRQTFLTLFADNKQEWFQKPIGLPKALSNKFDETQWDEAAEWYWSVYKHSFPNAKLFTLLRHPCDVVLSTAKHLGFEPASTWWTLGFMSYLLTHPSCPIDYAVHYEVLVENQEAVTRNLFDHLNVPFNSAVMNAFSTVHVPSRGRETIGANFSSRQAEWRELDPSIVNPFYIEQINKLFKKFNYTVHWPSHFEPGSFQAIDLDQSDHENNPSDLHETIDRLNRNIESIHLDHADKQIRLHNEIYKAREEIKRKGATIQALQNQLDNIMQSRGGQWLTKYWNTADKIKSLSKSNNATIPSQTPSPSTQPSPSVARQITRPNLSIDLAKEKSAVFVLPSGFTLGGVTSWSMEMCRRLVEQNKPAALIKYKNIGSGLNLNQPPAGQIIYCDGPQIPAKQEVLEFSTDYAKALPGTIIPNYNHRTYAVCATISQENANALRVIGYAHTDEDSYYALLYFYESIIHRFIAVSEEIGEKLRQLLPNRINDIIVQPYGVAVENKLDRHYSTADQPLKITYAGRISTVQKRILDLIKLVQELDQLNVNYQLNIIGDGSEKEELKREIGGLPPSIQQRISLKDPILPDQMPALWQRSDICILVSEYEGTSISLLESMAEGCVPVVTKVSGVQAVLENEQNGIFVPVGNMQEMAQQIKRLEENRGLINILGNQAHRTIVDRYDYDTYVDWFGRLTNEIWQESPRSWPKNKAVMTDWQGMKKLGARLTQQKSLSKQETTKRALSMNQPPHDPTKGAHKPIEAQLELEKRHPFFYPNITAVNPNQFVLRNKTGHLESEELPTPPPALMQYGENQRSHLKEGGNVANLMRDALKQNQIDINSFDRILEFGCSNGRVLRHLEDLASNESKEIWGCDIDANTVMWALENLSPPFHFFVNTTLPNLPIEQDYFDFVYAISIFTHMDDMLFSWLLEIKRILKPGGYAYLTFLDEVSVEYGQTAPNDPIHKKVLNAKIELENLMNGKTNMVVVNRDAMSMTFVRRGFILEKLSHLFEVVSIHEKVVANHQTAYLLRSK